MFSIAHGDEAKGDLLFNSRFVDAIHQVGTPQTKYKSKFVAQAWNDGNEKSIITYDRTVIRLLQLILMQQLVKF